MAFLQLSSENMFVCFFFGNLISIVNNLMYILLDFFKTYTKYVYSILKIHFIETEFTHNNSE